MIGSGLEEVYIPLLLKDWPETRLVFSEVLYDTSDAEPDGEWVEFYNVGDRRIDLSDYKFGDEESLGGREGMLRFPVGTIVEIKQTIIVASEAITFEARYGQPPDFEMRESDPAVPNMLKYTAWAGGNVSLDNNGDELLLLNEDNEVVDALSYGDSTFFFDPPAEKAKEGQSLARNPVNQDSDTAADWIVQATPDPWERVGNPIPWPDPDNRPRAERGDDATGDAYAGGILCENNSSPTFRNCIITDCIVTGAEGGAGANGQSTNAQIPTWAYIIPGETEITETSDGQWGGHAGAGSGIGYGGAMACLTGSKPVLLNCR